MNKYTGSPRTEVGPEKKKQNIFKKTTKKYILTDFGPKNYRKKNKTTKKHCERALHRLFAPGILPYSLCKYWSHRQGAGRGNPDLNSLWEQAVFSPVCSLSVRTSCIFSCLFSVCENKLCFLLSDISVSLDHTGRWGKETFTESRGIFLDSQLHRSVVSLWIFPGWTFNRESTDDVFSWTLSFTGLLRFCKSWSHRSFTVRTQVCLCESSQGVDL